MIKAIISDYGGVLIQMVDETPRQQLADRYHIPLKQIYKMVFDTEASRQAALGDIRTEQHWRAIHEVLHIPVLERAEFIRQFWSADALNVEMVNYLRRMAGRYTISLLSNANDDLRQMLNDRWRIADLFADMIISAEVGMLKPDLRIYQFAVERLRIQPEEAVFIDDLPANIEGARDAGLHAILYQNNQQVFDDLEALLAWQALIESQ